MPLSEHLTDEELVVVIREKNKELYSEIIRRYTPKLSHYLRKFVRNPDELEDVLQDVFIKTYRNLYDFDANKKFSSWVYRIAHNEAINHLKKYHQEKTSLDAQELEIIDKNINLPQTIDTALLKIKIENSLAQIKNKYREPLILYLFEQKTYEEIGNILQIPNSTVGVLIMRGKNLLKNFLQSYDKR